VLKIFIECRVFKNTLQLLTHIFYSEKRGVTKRHPYPYATFTNPDILYKVDSFELIETKQPLKFLKSEGWYLCLGD